jgi:ribose transport system substrate-binding protein
MKHSRILSILVLLLLVFTTAACSSPDTGADADAAGGDAAVSEDSSDKKFVIGATILTREHVFWTMVEESLNSKAEELGVEIIVSDGKNSADSQYAQIQDFVTQKVDAIIVAPVSSAASASATDLAKEAGIPVFSLVIDTNGEKVSFIGVDNILGGQLAGEYAAKALGEKGEVAVISWDDLDICIDRATGFKDEIAKYPGMKVVSEISYAGDTNKAASVTQDFITQFPDLKLIYAVGDPAAVGAVNAVKAAGKDIKVIGFDGNPEFYSGTKNDPDVWIADVQQDPKGCAAMAVEIAVDYLRNGTQPEPINLIPPTMIDTEGVLAQGL